MPGSLSVHPCAGLTDNWNSLVGVVGEVMSVLSLQAGVTERACGRVPLAMSTGLLP